jgi:hypothetical protein
VEAVLDGDLPQVRLLMDIVLDDGRVLPRDACLGQSVCILHKGYRPDTSASPPTTSVVPLSDIHAAQGDLRHHALRLVALEKRAAEAEAELAHLKEVVAPIIQGRTWRTVHNARALWHAAIGRRRST